jgi:hypothetical protein
MHLRVRVRVRVRGRVRGRVRFWVHAPPDIPQGVLSVDNAPDIFT